jgi:spore maturation protein A
MLNYIWLSLIVIGIIVAITSDIGDISTDKFRNGTEYSTTILFDEPVEKFSSDQKYPATLKISRTDFNKFYSIDEQNDFTQKAVLSFSSSNTGVLNILINEQTPQLWNQLAQSQKKDGSKIQGNFKLIKISPNAYKATIVFDPVKFTKLNSVTNDGIVRYAKTAVELAIGLIGIMALWLGVMKIAEASGLITKIAVFLKPITTRLFPDVPPDHPAMGAMIMNISANILGLANAATPLGLKAMEELNKLNRKLGTATDAMCTFLVINTSNVQLIPATVIAIRAAAGSGNPTEIIGPVIVATTVSTIVGVVTVKSLSKLKIFRRQMLEGSRP